MSASSQVTGIASGFDTAAIVGQLMQIEKIPYEKLDVKKQTQQLRLQAYQAVNSMLLKFRTSASSLSSQSLWRSKVATSTNEKSLTAIANQYAVNGSYSFKVAQLATASQFLTKGFASSKSAFVKQAEGEVSHKIGEITMSSAQTRVDTSAKINDLNGGKGVYRGSVRITDRANSTSIIDLSACDTMEDVVQALNASTGAQITASIKDGALHIEDNSGGSGAIRIQNVGAGSTATDLGIAGSSEDGDNFLQGRNVYVLGNDLSLSLLRDGLGIEEGMFTLRVTSNAQYYDVQVNIDDCHTVGDIIKRVNNEIEFRVQNHYNDPYSGGGWELLEGLRFGLSDDKTSFALLGVKEGHTYQFYDSGDMSAIAKQTPAAQLGLLGRNLVGSGQTSVEFARVLGAVDSPMIKNLAGVDGYGIGSAGSSYLIDIPFDRNTLISALNGGQGVDATMPLQLRLYEGGGDISNSPSLYKTFYDVLDQSALNDLLADPNATIQELVNFMNDSIARYAADPKNEAAGLWGLNFQIDEINQRLVIAGAQGGQKIEIMGTLANSLGLIRTGGNAIEQPNSPEVNDFYRGVTLISGNDDFNGASALGALDILHELDLSDPGNDADAVLAAILDKLNGSLNLNLQVNYIDGFGIPSVRSLQDVAVDLSDLGDDLNPDSTVAELMDAINARIQEAVNAAASAEFGETIEVSAPKLRIDTYGQGFQWSNLDTTKEFSASGTVAETLGVDRSLSPVETQPYDVLGDFRFNPKASGYLQEMAITGATQLGYLNNGASLTFAGNETDTIDFDFGEGNSISIKMGDLRTALKDTGNSLNTTLAEYADILTALVQDKLDDAGITVTVNFGVGDNRLEINVEGDDVRQLVISGAGADATRTGIGAVNVADIPVDGMTIGLAGLKAAQLAPQEVAGLGDINMTIGGIEIKLSTEGLSGDSTLAQLVDRLNRELEKAAAEPANAAVAADLRNVRFKLNDAGTGLAIDNSSGKELAFVNTKDVNTLAKDLGFIDKDGKGVTVDSYSHYNAGSLNRKYLSRATSLASIMGGPNVAVGSIQVTNAGGVSVTIDLSEAKTVGDVLDAINSNEAFGVQAFINERGDGINLLELYPWYAVPNPPPTGNIKIEDLDDGFLAKKLGIAGEGTRDKLGASLIEGTQRTTIEVMSNDTLETMMYRIAEQGYKTAIINDGTYYRLSVSSSNTGEASDFVIESNLDMFGFNQTSRAKDAKVLYGDPNSSSSPILLSSTTNSNSNAILGLTLDLKAVSSEWTTISVDTDTQTVVEELKEMVQTYNDLCDLVSYLDSYDSETGQPGILFGDSSIRKLMEDINEMFYLIFNPNQKVLGSVDANGKQQTWTWMDIGVSLSAKNTNADGSGNWYSTMDLNLDLLDSMVANNWDILYQMLAGQRNASNSTLDRNIRPTASFNGTAADGFRADNAINGDVNPSSWGVNNGFMADGTIAQGQNQYAIYFQQPTTISRMSIYHYDADTALKNYTIEYLDANTGNWEIFREINGNTVDANHFGMANPATVSAIRITADSTNASDGKFRLLDVQVFEDIGLAGKLNQLTTTLADSHLGFMAERNDEVMGTIKDIETQMDRLQERLDAKEANLWRRFTAMESALSQLQNQSNYFTSLMGSMTSNNKK